MEGIIALLELNRGYITRGVTNFRKTGAQHFNRVNIERRLELMKGYWDEARELHHKLVTTASERDKKEHPYFVQNQFALIEQAYDQAQADFLALLPAADVAVVPDAPAAPAADNSKPFQLPRIDLPKFSGSYLKWYAFKDQFEAIFRDYPRASNVQKLQVLKSCLAGDALLLIESLPMTEANYNAAWTALEERYANERLIIEAYLDSFISIPSLVSRNAKDLRNILVTASNAVIALTNMKICDEKWDPILVYLVSRKLDSQTRIEWEFELKDVAQSPSFAKIKSFLTATIRALEAPEVQKNSSSTSCVQPRINKSAKPAFRSFQTNVSFDRCILCHSEHKLYQCRRFREKPVSDRLAFARQNKCCLNCLTKGHFLQNCNSTNTCSVCKLRHHTLLHKPIQECHTNAQAKNQPESASAGSSRIVQTNAEIATLSSVSTDAAEVHAAKTILLPTAIVLLKGRDGRSVEARALLDQGSQATFISQSISRALHADEERIQATVSAVGENANCAVKFAAKCTIEPLHRQGPSLEIRALVLPRLTSYSSNLMHIDASWTHLHNLKFADPVPQRPGPIDLIIGSDYLGDKALQRFWDLDEIPQNSALSEEDRKCEEHFAQTHSRAEDGRYVVRLPFISEAAVDLPGSADIARRIFLKNESRLKANVEMFRAYQEFLQEYLSLGHMEKIADADSDRAGCYFSHHPVIRETSTTSRLRVVFNASMKCSNSKSLNDYLLMGPKLQNDLFALICCWRGFQFVLSADIAKMFRQILVDRRDTGFQKIFWRADPESPLESYRLLTVTYGTSSAPFLANRSVRQLSFDEGHRFPKAAVVLREQTYVDDVLFGADSLEQAQEIKREVTELFMAGGFRLRKWASNRAELLADIDDADHGLACDRFLQTDETLKLLGVAWNPASDCFYFQVRLSDVCSFTKRTFLSCLLRNFDPLGWISAVTVQAKMLMQLIWARQLSWDDELPADLNAQCLRYYGSLVHLQKISIPRWTGQSQDSGQLTICGFADASTTAYAALIYTKVSSSHGSKITLLIAKTKVAPLKSVSIPRLELCAAHLLAKLVNFVQASLKIPETSIWCCTDSTVALTWIRNSPSRWKTFIANRVSDIQSVAPTARWRHVPGSENPADLASRGLDAEKLEDCKLWWQGPEWLALAADQWPPELPDRSSHALVEQRLEPTVLATASEDLWEPFKPVSGWIRLLRITSFVMRFINRTRSKDASFKDVVLTPSEISDAELFWVRRLQLQFFGDAVQALKSGRSLPTKCTILKLSPFLDGNGILRVGGRLARSSLSYSQKFPMLLPNCDISMLVVRSAHLRTLHGGVRLLTYNIRLNFWIVSLRTLVKRCIAECVVCARQRAAPMQQLMAPLPSARVNPSRPFSHVGVDYAGPFLVRLARGRGCKAVKVFVSLFVCLSVKAIHLELVDSCSTADFLAAFDRFVARRGIPSDVYSDNGTNFIGADKELTANYKRMLQDPLLRDRFASDQVRWHFIPPGAPHFGGLWESGVKSLKHHLRRVLGAITPVKDEFATLLCNAESCLNSRPLAPLHDDVESLEALTPGHFLVGTSLRCMPNPSVLELRDNRLDRWQMVLKLTEQLWKSWRHEYLHSLQQRSVWHWRKANIKVGDLVLLMLPNLPPAKWELGRVTACHPGADNLVRVVTVRTSSGVFKRPIAKLCALPSILNDSCG